MQTKIVLSLYTGSIVPNADLINKSPNIYFFLFVFCPLFCLMMAIYEQFNNCVNNTIFIISSQISNK